ncbi:basic 7S globulin 2-like [Ananas comosus]|uniref:Basic 7S globulin 2-like n=1 Tax=Ananas comosus TaxID=4615 RepID=A0A6P5EB03_ANACO|nr:basic 7S globulin 2-like [Ananas comosus]
MSQSHYSPLLLTLTTFLLFIISTSLPPTFAHAIPINTLVAPIHKHSPSSLYTLTLNFNSQYVIDLTTPTLWSSCPSNHPTTLCSSLQCAAAAPRQCTRLRGGGGDAGHYPCTCTAYRSAPTTNKCPYGDYLTLTLTPIILSGPSVVSSCSTNNAIHPALPVGATGIIGLGNSQLNFPSQLSAQLKIQNQFAICLPSTTAAPGVAFFGSTKPFRLLPPDLPDLTTLLSYTPLIKNPKNPNGYYLDVEGILVNNQPVQFLERVLEFDCLGHGWVVISTTVPYTTLHSRVYRPFLKAFVRATSRIQCVPKVKPFDLCLNSSKLGSTRMGYGIAQIDVMLKGGEKWTIFGRNSLVQAGPEAACLAFVDGGPRAEQAVVVGGYQLEDHLLVFDLDRSRLGFTGSLLGIRTGCASFNFTVGV